MGEAEAGRAIEGPAVGVRGWCRGAGRGWPGREEHRKSGSILKMEQIGFATDRIWGVEKSKAVWPLLGVWD